MGKKQIGMDKQEYVEKILSQAILSCKSCVGCLKTIQSGLSCEAQIMLSFINLS